MARAADFDTGNDGAGPIVTPDPAGTETDEFGSVGFDFGGSGGGNSGDDFDASIHVGRDKRNNDGSYTRKRGRKAGGNTIARSQGKKSAPSVNAIENALVGIHAMAAAFTQTPELILDDDESKPLAQAVAELAKHYDIPGLDAKAMAWVGLIMVAGKVYVPRAVLIKTRLETEAKSKERPKPSLVVDLPARKKVAAAAPDPFAGFTYDPLNPPNVE